MELAAKHVLITGAAKRIGRHIAEALLKKGARLSAHYHHSQEGIQELVQLGERLANPVTAIQADLRDTEAIKKSVHFAIDKKGPVEILINGASVFYPTPSAQCTEPQWDDLMNVNLRGQFFFAVAVASSMSSKGGVILNIADVHASKPIRNYTPYAASKAGLIMMTRNLAKEWAPYIRVNSISPGPVLLPQNYSPQQRARSAERTLLKRIGSPEDILQAVLFLIGNDYITGFDLKVDGGRSLVE